MTALKGSLRWLPSLLVMGVIFTLSSLPSEEVPNFGFLDSLVKHGGHFLGYALLGLAYAFALPRGVSGRAGAMLAVVLALLYALTDEYHQSFVPGRSASWLDVMIDGLGALASVFVMRRYSPNSNSKPNSSSKS